MIVYVPIIILLVQVAIAALSGHLAGIWPGIFISTSFLFIFVVSQSVFLRRLGAQSFRIPQRSLHRYDKAFLLVIAIASFLSFFQGASSIALGDVIAQGQMAVARGEYLNSESKDLSPRLLGYLSLISTVFTVYLARRGVRFNSAALLSLSVAIMNSLLTFGRGYISFTFACLFNLYWIYGYKNYPFVWH